MRFEQFDIWWADVPYKENPKKSKVRPVIVWDETTAFVISVKMTSHEPRYNKLEGEYELVRWQDAGLTKPTVAQCSEILHLPEERFQTRIGRLSSIDIAGIKQMLNYMDIKARL